MKEKSLGSGKKCRHLGTHGVIRDISERRRLQTHLQYAERMESIGTLAGGIAHDFNNLLMGIQGRSALLAMDLKSSHPHLEHLYAIDDYIRSASDLTRQLLGFARGGKYEANPLNINELIETSAKMFGRTKKEIIIQTRFHRPHITVKGDRSQMEQVLLNLFVNAWQAMPWGGSILVETQLVELDEIACKPFDLSSGQYAHVVVSDTGIGMDPKTLHQIFDPFFTTKEKGRGTGLGLASAYGIIKNHGGAISVQSKMDCGTSFNIYLPITKKPAIVQCISKENVAKGSETVLLVDDEEMIIDVGREFLSRLGYHVVAVKSGEAAVAKVRQMGAKIDLVILDIIMPGMDGAQTFDQIRKVAPAIPVMLSSGYAIDDRVEKIMSRGCNGFIQKPFTLSEISQKVRSVIRTPAI